MKTTYRNTDTNEPVKVYQRKPTGNMLPCPGDAHSTPFIDNCGICAPRWGEVPEYAPADLDAAKRDGLVVLAVDVPDDVLRKLPAGAALVSITKCRGKRVTGYVTGVRF